MGPHRNWARGRSGCEEGADAEQKERPGLQGCARKAGTEERSTVHPVSAVRRNLCFNFRTTILPTGPYEINSELPIKQFLSHFVDLSVVSCGRMVPDYHIST